MKKSMMILLLALGVFSACQNDEIGLNPGITEISPADLPSSSQTYIDTNFNGEVVSEAYKVTGEDNAVTYEAFMTNNTNLVFEGESELCGFGNINSRMGMEGEMYNGGMQHMNMYGNGSSQQGGMMGGGMKQGGGMMGDGNGGMMGHDFHEFRGHPEAAPVELEINELPSAIIDYLAENYPDKEILKAFEVAWDAETVEIHVLIQEVGGLFFDEDGIFQDMIRRGTGHCEDFQEIVLEDLPAKVTEYIADNYPQNEIIRARLGSHDDVEEIHVMMDNIGVLVFDTNGNFIELMERRRRHHG